MTRLDRAALTVIVCLALAVALLGLAGNPFGLRAALRGGAGGSPYAALVLEFSAPVQFAAVEAALSLEPTGIAAVRALNPQQIAVTPAQPLPAGQTSTLRLAAGTLGAAGERLNADQTWEVTPRPPQIVFLGSGERPAELFVVALDGSGVTQLTDSGGRILSFDVSPDGEQIVYARVSGQGGVDLWLVDRDGQNPFGLLLCSPNRCTTPVWSPDGSQIAYTRESAPLGPNDPPGLPRAWVLDLATVQTLPMYGDSQILGYQPVWSPDGSRLAVWDGVTPGIRVLEVQFGQETILPTNTGTAGGFSPDGAQMLFTRFEPVGEVYHSFVYRADFTSGEIATFIDGSEQDAAFGVPAWSPDGSQIALSLRGSPASPARSIWIIAPDFLGGPTIGGEPEYSYGFYRWDPWSSALVFQRSRLGGPAASEIGYYELATGQMQILAEQGSFPQWLP